MNRIMKKRHYGYCLPLMACAAFFFMTFLCTGRAMAENEKKEVRIIVSENVSVKQSDIMMRDIAIIEGDSLIADRILDIKIAPSPRPGHVKTIMGMTVRHILEKNLRHSENTVMEIPEKINVLTVFQKIPDDYLKSLYEKKAAELSGGQMPEISEFRIRGTDIYSQGQMEIKPVPAKQTKTTGRMSLSADVYVDGKKEGRLTMSGRVEKLVETLTAARDIPRGALIIRDDLKIEKRSDRGISQKGIIAGVSAAVGKKAVNAIRSGSVIREKSIAAMPILKKGDRVKLVAKTGLLAVETAGEAVSEGCPGEQIGVRNLDSGKTVTARIIDASTVEVVF